MNLSKAKLLNYFLTVYFTAKFQKIIVKNIKNIYDPS